MRLQAASFGTRSEGLAPPVELHERGGLGVQPLASSFPMSLRLDPGRTDHLRPFGRIRLLDLRQLFGRATDRRYTETLEPLGNVRLLQDADDFGLKALHDGLGRAGRSVKSLSLFGFEVGYSGLRHGRDVRQIVEAFRRGHSQRP